MDKLTKSDKLFIDENDNTYGAWMKNPANKFFLYSEGYKSAGDNLYEFCIQNSFYNNSLVYPMIFTYRQYIELRLKELIIMGNKFNDAEDDFPDEHSLLKLWNYYLAVVSKIEIINPDILKNVERIITEFNTEDPQSMNFRYPVSKGPNRKESVNRTTIDLKNFKMIMDKLYDFFSSQWDMISNYSDMKDEMISNQYSNYWE